MVTLTFLKDSSGLLTLPAIVTFFASRKRKDYRQKILSISLLIKNV
ncbi:MAG: hypothetical protein CM15mP44_7710 [Candidatus Neomarinimicrobiota bacterium]|nr:MAG: hypothetical protein CM15mP44_7710 [Candidatus Neomarinimicrobiota bacterium]